MNRKWVLPPPGGRRHRILSQITGIKYNEIRIIFLFLHLEVGGVGESRSDPCVWQEDKGGRHQPTPPPPPLCGGVIFSQRCSENIEGWWTRSAQSVALHEMYSSVQIFYTSNKKSEVLESRSFYSKRTPEMKDFSVWWAGLWPLGGRGCDPFMARFSSHSCLVWSYKQHSLCTHYSVCQSNIYNKKTHNTHYNQPPQSSHHWAPNFLLWSITAKRSVRVLEGLGFPLEELG